MGRAPPPTVTSTGEEEADAEISAALESLRSRGVNPKAGGKLRKSASTAMLQTGSLMERTAIESVHGGLVVSLDADCRAYRAEIVSLTKKCAALEEQAQPASELHTKLSSLTEEVRLLRDKASEAGRAREALQETVARLKKEAQPREGLEAEHHARLDAALAPVRAECAALQEQLVQTEGQLHAERSAVQAAESALAVRSAEAERALGALEARCAQAERALRERGDTVEQLLTQLASLQDAHGRGAAEAVEAAETAASQTAALSKARAETEEARSEKCLLAKKLETLGEREREKNRKAGEQNGMLKSELGRVNELVQVLRARAEAAERPDAEWEAAREQEAARAKKRIAALEKAQRELQAEVLQLRTAADEARSEAEAARAKAELTEIVPGSAPVVRDGPTNPLLSPIEPGGTAFGKHQAKVASQQAEIDRLRAQVDHLSFLLSSQSAPSPSRSNAATSPLKLMRREPLRPPSAAPAGAAPGGELLAGE